jgi:hypothetical protein
MTMKTQTTNTKTTRKTVAAAPNDEQNRASRASELERLRVKDEERNTNPLRAIPLSEAMSDEGRRIEGEAKARNATIELHGTKFTELEARIKRLEDSHVATRELLALTTGINVDRPHIDHSVPVKVLLSADYTTAVRQPGEPTRPGMTGAAAASLDFPRTIASGTTLSLLKAEADALVAAGKATYV